jgi:hypothetical protein
VYCNTDYTGGLIDTNNVQPVDQATGQGYQLTNNKLNNLKEK